MKNSFIILLFMSTLNLFGQSTIYEFNFTSIDGVVKSFSEFKGKKILIVNTASECGYTPQYKELQAVHDKYKDKVVIIGFPANNFGGQEPGSNKDIATFCEKNYGVTFLLSEKVSVKGKEMIPLFKWLTTQANNYFTGDIKWNFEKFLIDENGLLQARFRSGVNPDAEEITSLF